MAKFKIMPTVHADNFVSAKFAEDVNDNDLGKAVKIDPSATDTYKLCADGDEIHGFIVAIEAATLDGKKFGTIDVGNMQLVEMDGPANVGDLVEATAQAALNVKEANGLCKVAKHTVDTTDVSTLAATTFATNWRIVSANTTDGTVASGDTTVVIAKC